MEKCLGLRVIFTQFHNVVKKITEGRDAPVADITVKLCKDFPYSDDAIYELFKELKWNTQLSAADLNLIHDDSMTDCYAKIEQVSEFMDDDGNCKVYREFPKEAYIK